MSVLTFASTELRPTDRSLWFDLVQGFFDEAEVRGDDVVIPGKAGRLVANRVADRRVIVLEGWVFGSSESAQLALVTTLHTIFDPTAAPATLRADGPYLGIAGGHYYSITARYLNAIWDKVRVGLPQRVNVTFEAVVSPPNWIYT